MIIGWTARRTRFTVLAITALLIGGLCWCSVKMRKVDRCIVHGMILSSVLQAYAKDHAGQLPSSLNELVQTGYLRCENNGQLRVAAEKVNFHGPFEGVSLFDVAWGATPDQADEKGYMRVQGRLLVIPAQGSPCKLNWCEGISEQVAGMMIAATHSPQSAPE